MWRGCWTKLCNRPKHQVLSNTSNSLNVNFVISILFFRVIGWNFPFSTQTNNCQKNNDTQNWSRKKQTIVVFHHRQWHSKLNLFHIEREYDLPSAKQQTSTSYLYIYGKPTWLKINYLRCLSILPYPKNVLGIHWLKLHFGHMLKEKSRNPKSTSLEYDLPQQTGNEKTYNTYY